MIFISPVTLEYYEEIGGNGILNHNQYKYNLYLLISTCFSK